MHIDRTTVRRTLPLPLPWERGELAALREVVALRPPRTRSWHAIHRRSHARYVIVDDEIAYTGGFGFADQWAGSGRRTREWRDSAVRVKGPLLPALASGFRALWAEASAELITGTVRAHPVPPPRVAGPGARADADLGRDMEEVFRDDLTRPREVRLEEFRQRPLHERAIEVGASGLGRLV